MSSPITFELTDGIATARPKLRVDVDAFIRQVADAVREARARGHAKLIVDTNGLEFGFETASIAARFDAATAWAEASGGKVALALVLRRDLIDPHGFTPTSAAMAGLKYMPFDDEARARAWLAGLA